jgi:hypothetical protein
MAATDKNTIGVTSKSQKVLDQMTEAGVFAEEQDAAKFAMAIAVRHGMQPGEVSGASTKWNVGSFDTDGQLRNMLPIIFPALKTPYRALESLIDSGLGIIAEEYLKGGGIDLAAIIKNVEKKRNSER